ncbi:SpoIIE family protein phosphatase [Methylolobus aquaticus]
MLTPRFHSLRTRLLWGIGLPLLALQFAVIALEYRLGRDEALDAMRGELGALTRLVAVRIDQALSQVAQTTQTKLRLLALNPEFSDTQRERLLRIDAGERNLAFRSVLAFRRKPARPAAPLRLYLLPEDGPVEPADPRTESILKAAWLDRALAARSGFWSGPHQAVGGVPGTVVSYVAPMLSHPKLDGAVSVEVPVARLQSVLRDADFESGGFWIADRAGTALATDDVQPLPAALVASWIAPVFEPGWRERSEGERIIRPPADATGGSQRWLLIAPLPATGWALLASVDEQAVLASVRSRLRRQVVVYAFGTAAVLSLLAWLSARATRPLVPLAEAARHAAAGDLDARVAGPLGGDEIGRFSMVFNRMMADLKANVAGRIEATAARQAVESELEVALKIQRTLLPAPFPVVPGVEIATRFVPARYVAGDFYDHFLLGPETLVVAIADVSGKGVAAALFMAAARTSIRNFTRPGVSPAQTLAAVNRALFEDNRQLVFVTTFLGHYDLPTGRLTYANAGHNLPYVVRSDGTPEVLGDSTGPLLAVFDNAEFGDRQAQLGDGDTLVLYTDGVVEASDPGGELYGEERLEALLRSNAAASPEALCTRITETVKQHCVGAPQDDVTLLVLRRQALTGARG